MYGLFRTYSEKQTWARAFKFRKTSKLLRRSWGQPAPFILFSRNYSFITRTFVAPG